MNSRFPTKWLMLVVGIAIGALAMWGFSLSQGIKPEIVEGYSTGTNYNGTALGVSKEIGGGGEGFSIAGAMWREYGGAWHQTGTPPSLAWPSTGQKVRLGVVWTEPTKDAPGLAIVVWLEVLSQ